MKKPARHKPDLTREIREAIPGHSERGKSVIERYGRISDEEFAQAIDAMNFDHGQTEIWARR